MIDIGCLGNDLKKIIVCSFVLKPHDVNVQWAFPFPCRMSGMKNLKPKISPGQPSRHLTEHRRQDLHEKAAKAFCGLL